MPKPGPRTITRYSSYFKATAVRLSQLPGVRVQDVAGSLYIHPFMLSRWRKQAREGVIMTKGVAVDQAVTAEPNYPGWISNITKDMNTKSAVVGVGQAGLGNRDTKEAPRRPFHLETRSPGKRSAPGALNNDESPGCAALTRATWSETTSSAAPV